MSQAGWPWAELQSWFTIDFIWGTRVCSMPQQRRLAEAEISIKSARSEIEKCFTWRDSRKTRPLQSTCFTLKFIDCIHDENQQPPTPGPETIKLPFFQFRISVSSHVKKPEWKSLIRRLLSSQNSKTQTSQAAPKLLWMIANFFFLPLALLSKIYFYRLLVFVCRIRWRNKKIFGRRKIWFRLIVFVSNVVVAKIGFPDENFQNVFIPSRR